MDTFALKIDLSSICQDVVYQKVMLLLDSKWQTVSDLESKIKKTFNIEYDIGFKNSEDFYIPAEEPAAILKHSDLLIAFKRQCSTTETIQGVFDTNHREINSLPKSFGKKRRNHLLNENFMTSTPDANTPKRVKGLSTSELSPVNKRNTREVENNSLTVCQLNSSTKSTNQKTKSISKDISKSNKHTFYNDSATSNRDVEDIPSKEKVQVVFHCELNNSKQNNIGRIFHIQKTEKHDEKTSNKDKTENVLKEITIKSMDLQQPSDKSSEIQFDSYINDLYTSETNKSLEQATEGNENSFDESVAIELSESLDSETCKSISSTSLLTSLTTENKTILNETPLTCLPNVGDNIIFKIKLTNGEISENIIGKCEYVNKRTKTIKLVLRDTHFQISKYVPQNYCYNLDNSNELQILNLKLQDMEDPRLLQT